MSRRFYRTMIDVLSANIHITLIVAIIMCLLITCSDNIRADIELRIESSGSISDNRHVNISLFIQNKADTQVVLYGFKRKIQPAMGGILFFDIIRDKRDTLVCRPAGPIPKYPFEMDTIVLTPEEIHREVVNLTSFYAVLDSDDTPKWDSTSTWGTREWEPGSYTIQCRYEYSHRAHFKGGRKLWRGAAISNIIEVDLK